MLLAFKFKGASLVQVKFGQLSYHYAQPAPNELSDAAAIANRHLNAMKDEFKGHEMHAVVTPQSPTTVPRSEETGLNVSIFDEKMGLGKSPVRGFFVSAEKLYTKAGQEAFQQDIRQTGQQIMSQIDKIKELRELFKK